MPINDYHFVTHWHMPATPEAVLAILSDAAELPHWWPSVYLEARQLAPGDENGLGKRVALYTKGWLPYTLRWQFVVTAANPPHGFTLAAEGDFVGQGIWTFEPEGSGVHITYDWRIRAEKPLLKWFSSLLKPIFAMNHHWAMRQGEISLELELRRRAGLPVPPDAVPPPTPSHLLRWLGYVLTAR